MKRIIATTDFSKSATHAVHFAAQLAQATGARLHLFHAFHVPVPVSDVPVVPDMESLQKDFDATLEKLANELAAKYGIIPAFKSDMGYTVQQLEEYCDVCNADLVVMGMRGHGKLAEVLLGSTSTDFVRNSKVPVLIVPEDAVYKVPRNIGLSTDLHEESMRTYRPLKELAGIYNSRIFILNVVKGKAIPGYDQSVTGIQLDHYFETMEHLFFFPENNDVIGGIEQFITKYNVDWLAVVPHKHNFMERLFQKSITKKMAFHTHIPVLVLPEKENLN